MSKRRHLAYGVWQCFDHVVRHVQLHQRLHLHQFARNFFQVVARRVNLHTATRRLLMDHLSLTQLLNFPVSTYLVVYGAHWTVWGRLKADVQQALHVGNSPQIVTVVAVLRQRRWCTSSKTARWQGFLAVSRLYILLKIVVLSGSTRKAYDKESAHIGQRFIATHRWRERM